MRTRRGRGQNFAHVLDSCTNSLILLQPLVHTTARHDHTLLCIHEHTRTFESARMHDIAHMLTSSFAQASTNSLKEVTVNDMGGTECIFRQNTEHTNRTRLQQSFIDNESTIQLLIQRHSLPVPYSTQRSVTMDRHTASRLC